MKNSVLCCFVCIFISLIVAHGFDYKESDIPPETVDNLDVPSFLGRWYQMYASLIPNLTFEKNGFCVTGDYFNADISLEKVEFQVVDSQNVGSPNGSLAQEQESLVNKDPRNEPGKYINKIEGAPRNGIYWIIALGEKEGTNDQYPWAVISVPLYLQVYILARDVEEFNLKYKWKVLQYVYEQGFITPFNKPLETYQGSDCEYSKEPNSKATF